MTGKVIALLSVGFLALFLTTCSEAPTEPNMEEAQAVSQPTPSGQEPEPDTGGESTQFTSCPTPGNPSKVLICHVPPGNPPNAHEICVGQSAVPAHLAHGDFLGECPICEPGDPYCCPPDDPYCCPPGDPYCDGAFR